MFQSYGAHPESQSRQSPTPPTSTSDSSLLTFADMVLALDQRAETVFDGSTIKDHNYANNDSKSMFTRSKSHSLSSSQKSKNRSARKAKSKGSQDDLTVLMSETGLNVTVPTTGVAGTASHDSRVKRSSSFENIQSNPSPQVSSDWPDTSARTSSPRKSCSYEEVNNDCQPSVKTSKSTENIPVSGL